MTAKPTPRIDNLITASSTPAKAHSLNWAAVESERLLCLTVLVQAGILGPVQPRLPGF
jgi:hypothetical protein